MQHPHFTIEIKLTNFHQVPHELIILLMCQLLKTVTSSNRKNIIFYQISKTVGYSNWDVRKCI